jgi:hypothetical protein
MGAIAETFTDAIACLGLLGLEPNHVLGVRGDSCTPRVRRWV